MKPLLLLLFLLFSVVMHSQATWHLLPNSPSQTFRHDDVFFINENKGWVINVKGEVWKTLDGGTTWNKSTQQSSSFRCVGFSDSLRGFIGNLCPGSWAATNDTVPLYKTTDGGNTWSPITVFNGPFPKGICGIRVVNDSVIVGCGRVGGPSFFVRSTDGGVTWTSKDMSSYAGMLIDVSFISADTGFVVGGTTSSWQTSKSIILYTTDGGQTWTPKITGTSTGDHCWKIEKTKTNTYYVSVERSSATLPLLFYKSSDGGSSWTEHTLTNEQYGWSQGIGFVSDTVGWIGGGPGAISTSDGGQTFSSFPLLVNMNRMRVVNETLAYAVGQRVYKYSKLSSTGITQLPDLTGYSLQQNVPNPFTKKTTLTYTIPKPEHVVLEIFDNAGRKIKTLVNAEKSAGTYTVVFEVPEPAHELFICSISAGYFGKAIKMFSLK